MKKAIKIVSVFLGLLLLMPIISYASASSPNNSDLNDYKQIPGITDEEINAIENLQSKHSEFSFAVMPSNSECFVDENGEMSGYTPMLCDWLSEIFDIKFTPVFYDWPDTLNGLADYSIDFTGELTATPERREFLHMTDSISERTLKVIRHVDSKKVSESTAENPVRCGFLAGTTSYSYVEPYVSDIEVVYAESLSEVFNYFEEGKIDAFIVDGTAEALFDKDTTIIAEDFSPMIYAPVSMSTQNPDLIPIIDAVQKILESDYSYRLSEMYKQGYTGYLQHKLMLQLSPEEKEYIRKHIESGATIPYVLEYDNYPVSFYNTREKQWQGASYDIITEIEKITGLDFEIANKSTDVWSELLHMLNSEEALMVTELLYSPEREKHYIWAQEPYCKSYYSLISKSEYPDVSVSEIAHLNVGLVKDTAHEEFFYECFPGHNNVIEYQGVFDAVNALEKGEVDLLMATNNILLSITNYLEKPGFKTNLVFSHESESFFGFPMGEDILCSIVSKAQRLVDTSTITDRWQRTVFDYRGTLERERRPLWAGLAVMVAFVITLLVVLIIRNRHAGALLEATVKERTKELEIASQAKSEFLARMSHEIRTPLNAIIGMTAIAKAASSREKIDDSLNEVDTASHHLLDILNDVLDMSKIESGKFVLAHEEFQLRTVMKEVATIIIQRCTDKQISFEENISELPELTVLGDKLRLKQVLINLLGNAVKFTHEGGDIKLLVDVLKQDKSLATVSFVVADTGIGIKDSEKDRLFLEFEQADSTIASRFGGTGLGLAISQNLVGMMGGVITVESEPDKGSTFSFNLPMVITECTDKSELSDSEEMPDLSGKKMLLAEDVYINRVIVQELLASSNIEIHEAEDGKRAVEMFEASAPGYYSVIFMDIQMPVLNGYQATKTIRVLERADASTIPIIALTAHAYQEDIQEALGVGMNGHLTKPVDLSKVAKLLRQLFEE